jgi:MoxR-like ATPase
LSIDLQAIYNITPFKGSINTKFLPIIRNNYPKPLNDQKYLEFRNFLLSKCDNMKIYDTGIKEEQVVKYLILRTQPGSTWEDKEGIEYHYGTNVPRHSQVAPRSYVIFDRNTDRKIEYIGCAKVSSVREEDKGRRTHKGRPIVDKVASLEDYQKFEPPVVIDTQIQKMIESIPNYNNQHSIRVITKEIFELITQDSFRNNQKYAPPGDWFSLSSSDIEEVIEEVLDRDGIRLEVEPEIVKRIINHLVASKNVILVGPPGTGKTDLARRLLRVLGRKIIGKEEPVEAVASYEWGRYEVIGGNSLSREGGDYIFHYGCVTKAIKEGKFLLIDEFNRADMNKAFGEMFLAVDHGRIELREDERPSDLVDTNNSYATTPFISVPPLFRMICTMNDYDKSILNDLSYGLLRRFAFVEIDIPKDGSALKDMIIQRIKNDLSNLDSDSVLDRHISEVNEITEKFVDFVYEISQMRKLGVSTMLDVIRYIIAGIIVRNEQNYWKLFNEAMIDYVLPQFDRLDIDTLRHVKNTSLAKFRTIESSEPIPEVQPSLTNIEKMLKRLEELSDIFENK